MQFWHVRVQASQFFFWFPIHALISPKSKKYNFQHSRVEFIFKISGVGLLVVDDSIIQVRYFAQVDTRRQM